MAGTAIRIVRRGVAISFPPATLERIAIMAAKRRVAFAVIVRELCHKALAEGEVQ